MFVRVQALAAALMVPVLEQCDDVQASSANSNLDYPLQLLKDFRCSNSHSCTSEQFLAHLLAKLGSQNLQRFFTLNGWKQLFKVEEDDLLTFFVRVYPDFNDYPTDMLLEWWHRLTLGAGSNWTLDIIDQFAVSLNSHFSSHENYKCRQTIENNDIMFIYRRFGIVPSKSNFHDAAKKMIACIEHASTSFSILFTRFASPDLLTLTPCCRLCCQRQPEEYQFEFMTTCPLSKREFAHRVSLCADCSKFVRHTLVTCPCCHRGIAKDTQLTK